MCTRIKKTYGARNDRLSASRGFGPTFPANPTRGPGRYCTVRGHRRLRVGKSGRLLRKAEVRTGSHY